MFFSLSLFVVPCRSLFWPGAAVLYADRSGKSERHRPQREQNTAGNTNTAVLSQHSFTHIAIWGHLSECKHVFCVPAAQSSLWPLPSDPLEMKWRWERNGFVFPHPHGNRHMWRLWTRTDHCTPEPHKKDDTSGMYMHAHIDDIKLASLHASAHSN